MSVLDNIGREVQEEDLLCWAAVSTMAVRAFPEDAAFKHPTQREIVIYQRAGINSVAKLGSALGNPNSALGKKLTSAQGTCSVLGMCNAPNVDGLHLYDLASKKVGAGKVLLPEHFEIEIDDRGCPVPIRWTYEGRKPTHGRLRTGEHALIVTGYRWETHELRVWDPWPSLLNPDPSPGPHEKWIPYDTYVDPQNDEGLDALALHEFDQYKLRRKGRNISAPIDYPPLGTLMEVQARRLVPLGFEGEIAGLREAVETFLRGHVVRNSSGDVIHGPYTAGDPFPIVPLKTGTLRKTPDPESLLTSQTAAVVIPVLKDRQVIDSFLMLHGKQGWRAGGYSNNRIAGLLSEARDLHTSGERHSRGFYLVSVPELSTFYVAHGFNERATLAPLNVVGRKNFVRSRQALGDLLARIKGKPVAHPVDDPKPV